MDRKLQRHRADSLRQHGFLVRPIKDYDDVHLTSASGFSDFLLCN